MKVSYGYASIELRKRECNDVRKRGRLKLKNACAIAGIFILLFQQTPSSAFITISYLFLFLIQHIRDGEVLVVLLRRVSPFTIHHGPYHGEGLNERRRVRRG